MSARDYRYTDYFNAVVVFFTLFEISISIVKSPLRIVGDSGKHSDFIAAVDQFRYDIVYSELFRIKVLGYDKDVRFIRHT